MRAVISGAAGGIGRAVAYRLNQDSIVREGRPAQIVIADMNQIALEDTAEGLRAAGAEVVALAGDITDITVPKAIIEAAADRFAGLDALVSNAGIIHIAPLLELSVEDYERTFAINTRATFLLATAAHPLLKASQGAIVATTSIAAHEPTPALGVYSASKAALLMMVRQMANDWGSDGIRSNTVSPGSTRTGIGRPGGQPQAVGERVGRNPLGMVAEPEDQAAVIAFLLGPDARFINGADIVVDGGARTQLMTALGMARTQE